MVIVSVRRVRRYTFEREIRAYSARAGGSRRHKITGPPRFLNK
jgi:hypothetical protein